MEKYVVDINSMSREYLDFFNEISIDRLNNSDDAIVEVEVSEDNKVLDKSMHVNDIFQKKKGSFV